MSNLNDLGTAWRVLGELATKVTSGTPGFDCLLQARRLIEEELLAEYGIDTITTLTSPARR
ncbi:MAG TPA: hypothetical protein VE990_13615 [Acidimicrobiales bacterium]|nr:hypothetical protein [Acidimicrobiales bacterium]